MHGPNTFCRWGCHDPNVHGQKTTENVSVVRPKQIKADSFVVQNGSSRWEGPKMIPHIFVGEAHAQGRAGAQVTMMHPFNKDKKNVPYKCEKLNL
jgi:hypothetical protein